MVRVPAMGSTQPVTAMSVRNIKIIFFGSKAVAGS
jgi:hypothetical protein